MTPTPTTAGLVRAVVLPAVLLFVVPLFAYWFSNDALNDWDAEILASIESSIANAADLDDAQRSDLLAFYRAVPASVACTDFGPDLAGYRESLGEGCSDLSQFGWARRVSLASIFLGLLAALVAGLCALAAFVSRPFQYGSFVVGWNLLRVLSALQVVAQGALVVWLSFWVTALWFNLYFPKLILLAGVAALFAVLAVVAAIFKRPPEGFEVDAEVLEPSDAPEFWAHVRALCERVQTTPPDHILVGIDDNFFVTESKVRVGDRELEGRTLFASLSLLRQLERSEADAVLAHEMAHLLGGDTGHSKKLAPMLARFGIYLDALASGGLTLPVFFFMRAYNTLFQLSLSRSSRQAELAADALAAKTTSPGDIARSLVKVGAYSNFRQRVESELFATEERQSHLAISQRVAAGFTNYAQSKRVQSDLQGAVTPHPFDTHPPLGARLAHVGASFTAEELQALLVLERTSSWVAAIPTADAIESRMWSAYEARFSEAHELSLAYRYEPSTDEERQHVEKYFPPRNFAGKKPGYEVQMDFAQLSAPHWEAPVTFAEVGSASTNERVFKKYLDLLLLSGDVANCKRAICLNDLADPDGFLKAFELYYGRRKFMEQHRAESAAVRDSAA